MAAATTRLIVDKQAPGYWRVTLDHPPINTVDDLMYDEIFDLVQAIDAEPALKVVTFESAIPTTFSPITAWGSPRAASARRAGATPRSSWLIATSSASP